jgi:hypothetical protein
VTPVDRARLYLGCAFRPQGREASTGFDCVGLVCAAHQIDIHDVPRDYRSRGNRAERLLTYLGRFFFPVPTGGAAPGDVMLLQPRIGQLHLGILTDRGLIHADAKLRKVVETPRTSTWPVLSAHRRSSSE